jgi:acyl-CoA reductase-like NAD-dependent aldehyde dehydrogenase
MSGVTEISPSLQSWLGKEQKLFIDGIWVEGGNNQTFPSINPATEAVLTQVAMANETEVELAVRGARRSFDDGRWSKKNINDRREVLKKLGDLILSHKSDLSVLETLDTGKPITETREGDIPRAANNFHFFSSLDPQENHIEFADSPSKAKHYAAREPMGVVALVTPWNLPLCDR